MANLGESSALPVLSSSPPPLRQRPRTCPGRPTSAVPPIKPSPMANTPSYGARKPRFRCTLGWGSGSGSGWGWGCSLGLLHGGVHMEAHHAPPTVAPRTRVTVPAVIYVAPSPGTSPGSAGSRAAPTPTTPCLYRSRRPTFATFYILQPHCPTPSLRAALSQPVEPAPDGETSPIPNTRPPSSRSFHFIIWWCACACACACAGARCC